MTRNLTSPASGRQHTVWAFDDAGLGARVRIAYVAPLIQTIQGNVHSRSRPIWIAGHELGLVNDDRSQLEQLITVPEGCV